MRKSADLVNLDIIFDKPEENYRVSVPRFDIDRYIEDKLKDKNIKAIRKLDNYQIFYNQLELF